MNIYDDDLMNINEKCYDLHEILRLLLKCAIFVILFVKDFEFSERLNFTILFRYFLCIGRVWR